MTFTKLAFGAAMLLIVHSPTLTTPSPFTTTTTTTTTTTRTSDTIIPYTTRTTSVCSLSAPTLSAVPGQVGYLTSPNYPSPYYNNADCRWLIDAGSGYVVKVSVFNVSLETCCDFLELYNGTNGARTSLIIRTSFRASPTDIYSSGQYMYIRFHSDASERYSGFRLTYEAIDQPTSVCSINGTTFSAVPGQVGYLTSPYYPSDYYSLINCSWTVNSTSGYVVKATVLNVTNPHFYFDIAIYDGLSESSPRLAHFPDIPKPTVYYSSGQSMYIRLITYGVGPNTSFNLTYEAVDLMSAPTSVCSINGTTFSAVAGQVGYLTALYYPTVYHGTIDCSWTINSTSGYVVKTTLLNVTNPEGYFYISIYDGMSDSSPKLTWIYSMPSPIVYYSSGQSMYIRLITYGLGPNSFFNLTYEAVDQWSSPRSVCSFNGTTFSAVAGQVGYLSSPYYPSVYSRYVTCSWTINSTSGYVVKATLLSVTNPEFFSQVVIYDAMSESSSLAQFSSMPAQTVYYSSGQYMYIKLITYGVSPNSSFNLTYEAVDQLSAPMSVCSINGTTFSAVAGQVGYLRSLYYPTLYSGIIYCSWTIISPTGYVVKTTVFNVTNPEFSFYIAIYDGISDLSPLLVQTYGIPYYTVYYSSGQSMHIRLTTYGLSPNSSLNLTYEAVDQLSVPTSAGTSVCSVNAPTLYVVPGQVGYLTSPNYPSPYYNYADCQWLINAGSGYIVKVTVTDVSLDTCCDYLELYNGTQISSSSFIIRTSSTPSQTVFYSSGQYMYIRFYSDRSVTSSGFRLTYEASLSVCPANGTALSALPGQVDYLSFPNHPSSYSNKTDCRWVINSTSGDVVKVTVVNASSDIFFYYIQIFDGMSESSPTLATFYGMPPQTDYYSSGQYMYIRFTGYGSVTNSGLRVTYEAVNQPSATTWGPTTTTTALRAADPCTCTCSCVSTCSRP